MKFGLLRVLSHPATGFSLVQQSLCPACLATQAFSFAANFSSLKQIHTGQNIAQAKLLHLRNFTLKCTALEEG